MNSVPLIVTHNDSFHVDEIFAIAILSKIVFGVKDLNKLDIIRTRDENLIEKYKADPSVYVIDVGREYERANFNFDHHQNDPSLKWDDSDKPDGLSKDMLLSSCGLIWKWIETKNDVFFGYSSLSDTIKEDLKNLVKSVDLCDNGLKSWDVAPIFYPFNRYGKNVNEEIRYHQFRLCLNEAGKLIQNILDQDKDLKSDHRNNEILGEEMAECFISTTYHFYAQKIKDENLKTEWINLIHDDKFKIAIFKFLMPFFETKSESMSEIEKNEKVSESLNLFYDNLLEIAKRNLKSKIELVKSLELSEKNGHKDVLLFEDDNHNARVLVSKLSDNGLICATYHKEKDSWDIILINKDSSDPYTGRIQMPKKWAGLEGEELCKESGFDNMIFAHKGRFIVVMKGSKDECLKVCQKIIEISKEEV